MLLRVNHIVASAVLAGAILLSRDAPGSIAPIDSRTTAMVNDRVAGALHRLIDQLVVREVDRSALETFYRGRGFAPLWVIDGKVTKRARSAIDYLKNAGADGLRAADYSVPEIKRGVGITMLAAAELRLTLSALTYARHAERGRIVPADVSPNISYPVLRFDRLEALARLAGPADITGILASFEPPQPEYRALKVKLKQLRADVANWTPEGTQRERLREKIETILVNMERWRWMPRDLGTDYVMVNIPDFRLEVVRGGVAVWTTKVAVGAPTWPTPVISADMTSITLNPTWNIPKSMVKRGFLSEFSDDPDKMERLGIHVIHRANGTVHVFQVPGQMNALGQIRFNFPNKFAVFQHDTPDKFLFTLRSRAISHGCMRVEHPLGYAATLLAIVLPEQGYSVNWIYGRLGGDERNIEFPRPIPVHLTYQTAFVDASGNLQIRDDVYGYDRQMLAALVRESPLKLMNDVVVRTFRQKLRTAWTKVAGRVWRWFERQEDRLSM